VRVGGYNLKVQSYDFLTQSKLLLSNLKVFDNLTCNLEEIGTAALIV
jgi:hypothetical protein